MRKGKHRTTVRRGPKERAAKEKLPKRMPAHNLTKSVKRLQAELDREPEIEEKVRLVCDAIVDQGLVIQESGISDYGLFVTKPLKKGDRVCSYEGYFHRGPPSDTEVR